MRKRNRRLTPDDIQQIIVFGCMIIGIIVTHLFYTPWSEIFNEHPFFFTGCWGIIVYSLAGLIIGFVFINALFIPIWFITDDWQYDTNKLFKLIYGMIIMNLGFGALGLVAGWGLSQDD